MPKRSHGCNLSKGDAIEVPPEVLKELLSHVPDEPLKHVEEIILPEPWPPFPQKIRIKQVSSKRGPKSPKLWASEVRKDWGNLNDVDKLGRSWLADLPKVQRIAASKYDGGMIGRGRALKELLAQALIEAREYNTDGKTHAMLSKYPDLKIKEIAEGCGVKREHFSRLYCRKATAILTMTFQRIIGRKSNI